MEFKQIEGPLPANDRYYKKMAEPKVGMMVALHNVFPPQSKYDLGFIIDINKERDPSFPYRVFEYGDQKTYWHHISMIIPIELVFDE